MSQLFLKTSSSTSFALAISSLTPPLQLALSSHHIMPTSLLHLMRAGKGKSGVAHSLLMSHLYWIYLRPINQPTPVTTSYFRSLPPPPQTNGNHDFLFAPPANDTGGRNFSISVEFFSATISWFCGSSLTIVGMLHKQRELVDFVIKPTKFQFKFPQ